jgi:hypothetical protein
MSVVESCRPSNSVTLTCTHLAGARHENLASSWHNSANFLVRKQSAQLHILKPLFLPTQAYKLRAELDKLASFGRPIWITEMDSAEVDEQKKADMLEFAYREYFAHPAVEGILMWTVWEGPATTCQV